MAAQHYCSLRARGISATCVCTLAPTQLPLPLCRHLRSLLLVGEDISRGALDSGKEEEEEEEEDQAASFS